MKQEEAKQFYDRARVPRYGLLQTSKRHLFTEFARQGRTDPQFTRDLTTLGTHIARLHTEATTTNKTDAFKQKANELIKHHETTMTRGVNAKDALRRLNRHFKAPTLKEFLKQTAVAAVKEKPTLPAPKSARKPEQKPASAPKQTSKPAQRPRTKEEEKALRAASVSLPRTRSKPGLLRHALGLAVLGGLLYFGGPYAIQQLPKPTKVELKKGAFGRKPVVPIRPFEKPKPPKDSHVVSGAPSGTTVDAEHSPPPNIPVHAPLFEIVKMPGKDWEAKLKAYVKQNKVGVIMENHTIEPGSTSEAAQAQITTASAVGTPDVSTEHNKKGKTLREIEATPEALAREAEYAIADAHKHLRAGNPDIAARHYAKAISMGRRLEGEDLARARRLILLGGKAYNSELKRALDEWHPRLEGASLTPTPQ